MKTKAPAEAIAHSGLGFTAVWAARTTTAAGMTIRFGMIRCSRSVAEIATRARQKKEATRASACRPNFHTQPATRSAADASTAGYRIGMRSPQDLQRP